MAGKDYDVGRKLVSVRRYPAVRITNLIILVALLIFPAVVVGQTLSKEKAIAKAEEFVVRNGYTEAKADKIKLDLD